MRTKKSLHTLILALSLTVILLLIVGYLRPIPLKSKVQREQFWLDKVFADSIYDIVVCGDSRIYRGISPLDIGESIDHNVKVLNFGFSSGGINKKMINAARKKLNPNSKNKCIVLGISPYALTRDSYKNKHYLQELNRKEDDIIFKRYIQNRFSFFEPILPSEIIKALKNDSTGYYHYYQKDGWVKSFKNPEVLDEAIKSYKKVFMNNQVNDTIINEVLNCMPSLRKDHIQVVAFRVPVSLEMQLLENELSGFDEHSLKKALTNEGVVWLELKNIQDYHSYDGSHLHYKSAQKLSQWLGENINEMMNDIQH